MPSEKCSTSTIITAPVASTENVSHQDEWVNSVFLKLSSCGYNGVVQVLSGIKTINSSLKHHDHLPLYYSTLKNMLQHSIQSLHPSNESLQPIILQSAQLLGKEYLAQWTKAMITKLGKIDVFTPHDFIQNLYTINIRIKSVP